MWIFQKYFWRLYDQIWIDVHRLKQLMFSPIRAISGQDIAAYAHVKRPDSAYKEAFVFLDVSICWYLCICVNIRVYLCISNSGLREQRKESACFVEALSLLNHTRQRAIRLVAQEQGCSLSAKSWPMSWCKRGNCPIPGFPACHPCHICHAHSMLPSCFSWSKGSSQYLQRAQEAVGPGCGRAGPRTPPGPSLDCRRTCRAS